MHQVAQPYVNRSSNHQLTEERIRTVLLMANTLDCELLAEILGRHPSVEIVASTADAEFGLVRCKRLRPQVLIIDPKVTAEAAPRSAELVRSREVRHLIVLDDRLHEGRLTSLLSLPSVSYLTRQAGLEPLLAGILQIVTTGERAFDPLVQSRIHRQTGRLRLERPADRPSIGLLTSRELEVMKLLAGGYSVRSCAERLELAISTIDNHKSRLMKKLDIHKVVELTHVAIREGLIVV